MSRFAAATSRSLKRCRICPISNSPLDLRKCKDSQYSTLITETADVRKRADSSQGGRRIFAANISSDSDAGPSADTGEHCNILLSIRSGVRHRITDDPRRRLEFP